MYFEQAKKVLWLRLLTLALSMMTVMVHADVVVIVHPSNDTALDKATLKKIFMGRTKEFPDGKAALPFDLEDGPAKKEFIEVYLQKDQGSLDSYWARMIFTGGGAPPKAYKSGEELVKAVAGNSSAIGYIDESLLNSSVKAIKID